MTLLRTIPPFIFANDVTRGFFCGAEALLGYAFMLALMLVVLSDRKLLRD